MAQCKYSSGQHFYIGKKLFSLMEISFLRHPSDLVVAQEQLKILALKVERQDIDIPKERGGALQWSSFCLKSEFV